MSDSTVAPMIVVAAITRIKIPIAKAILTAPQHSSFLIALILTQVCAEFATSLAKLRPSQGEQSLLLDATPSYLKASAIGRIQD
jgi:hypothetical protein